MKTEGECEDRRKKIPIGLSIAQLGLRGWPMGHKLWRKRFWKVNDKWVQE